MPQPIGVEYAMASANGFPVRDQGLGANATSASNKSGSASDGLRRKAYLQC